MPSDDDYEMFPDGLVTQAKKCQRTWGFGFPVISLELLRGWWGDLEDQIKEMRRATAKIQGHWCAEWDGMFVTNLDPEFSACLCFKEKPDAE